MKFHVTLPDTRAAAHTWRSQVTQAVLPHTHRFLSPAAAVSCSPWQTKHDVLLQREEHVTCACSAPRRIRRLQRAVQSSTRQPTASPSHPQPLFGRLSRRTRRLVAAQQRFVRGAERGCNAHVLSDLFRKFEPFFRSGRRHRCAGRHQSVLSKIPAYVRPAVPSLHFDALDAAPDDSDISPQNSLSL